MFTNRQLGGAAARGAAVAAPAPAHRRPASRRAAVRVAGFKGSYKVVIVGGGSAGATVASHYVRKLGPGQVAVIEPSHQHYYQPLWTLVGGGFKGIDESRRPMSDVLPAGADWIPASVSEFLPSDNRVSTSDGRTYEYDYLVVATGMQAKWGRVKGLPEALGDGAVVSNMSPRTAPMTYTAVRALRSGHALFTMPKGVVKCPGAAHKACYISEDHLRRAGRRPDVAVTLALAGDKIFGVPRYAATISALVADRGIDVRLNTNLVEVRGPQKEAVFEVLGQAGQAVGERVMKYDMLHVTPPQGPLDVVARSQLANEGGWVATDPETMQHTRYPNVFGIGDCAAVPTSKTAAAAAAQFLVLRDNLDSLMAGGGADGARYDGYSSCPLVTKRGACMMMEFGYGGKIMETFTPLGVVDQSKEDYLMWLVKTEALPWAYWNLMTKGYVPWGEYKNALKRLEAKPAAAAAPAAQQQQQGGGAQPAPEPTRR